MYKKERLTYTITEQFPEGDATLILYAWFDDFGGIGYYFDHDQLHRGCDSFDAAILAAKKEWEKERMNLIVLIIQPAFTEEYDSDIADIF